MIRNFVHCTDEVKIKLFKSFCSNLYCCPLWYHYKKSTINKLHVASNKVFKTLMKIPSRSSASQLFVACNVPNFLVLRRKLVCSLRCRVNISSNELVNTFVNEPRSVNAMHSHWNEVLYRNSN